MAGQQEGRRLDDDCPRLKFVEIGSIVILAALALVNPVLHNRLEQDLEQIFLVIFRQQFVAMCGNLSHHHEVSPLFFHPALDYIDDLGVEGGGQVDTAFREVLKKVGNEPQGGQILAHEGMDLAVDGLEEGAVLVER
jgi:hypothetical protein